MNQKIKLYIMTRTTHYESTSESYTWANAYPTREEAEDALDCEIRDMIESQIEGCEDGEDCELSDDDLAIHVTKARENGGEMHDADYEYGDARIVCDIFESEMEVAK